MESWRVGHMLLAISYYERDPSLYLHQRCTDADRDEGSELHVDGSMRLSSDDGFDALMIFLTMEDECSNEERKLWLAGAVIDLYTYCYYPYCNSIWLSIVRAVWRLWRLWF